MKENEQEIGRNGEKEKEAIKKETDENPTNDKSAKSLGDGRWSYQGKIYKEERIGRS
jgi:hypothetical protein